jgi:mutator protein MutT
MGREFPKRPLVGVGAVIIENGRILLVKRGNEPNKGKWSVPGGLVRIGESLIEALKREIREEVGVEIEVDDVACVSEEIFRNGEVKFHYVIIDFFARIVDGNVRPGSDAEEIRWVPINEVDKIEVVDFVEELIKSLVEERRKIFIK